MTPENREARFKELLISGHAEDPFVINCVMRTRRSPDRRTERWIVGTVGVVAAVAMVLILRQVQIPSGTGKVKGLVLIAGALIPAAIAQAFYRSRFASRFGSAACRSCGYSLAEIPSDADVTIDGPLEPIGPEFCPECGQSWPLIFPQ